MEKIYADTSVIGGCLDTEFKEYSLSLLEEFKSGNLKLACSDLVLMELKPAREEIKNKLNEIPNEHIIDVNVNPRAIELALTYIEYGALTNKSYHDALHIAMATLNNVDALASWNFKHIVNFDKIKMYNAINLRLGYKPIEIMTPRLILNINDL
jgi:predicted nucleic acid-binding protein